MIKKVMLASALMSAANFTWAACSCSDYFPKQPRPSWVDNQIANQSYLQVSGLARCTGLKELDLKRAANNAKVELAELLNTHIESSATISQSNVNSANYRRFEQSIRTQSSALLQEATIVDNWVDDKYCTVYRSLSIDRQTLNDTIAKTAEAQRNQLYAQTFYLNSKGPFAQLVLKRATMRLESLGVTTTSDRDTAQLVLDLSARQDSASKTKVLLDIEVQLKALDNSKRYLYDSYSGKAISFTGKPKKLLAELAIDDALDSFEDTFKRSLTTQL